MTDVLYLLLSASCLAELHPNVNAIHIIYLTSFLYQHDLLGGSIQLSAFSGV